MAMIRATVDRILQAQGHEGNEDERPLSPREREILTLLLHGQTVARISRTLQISRWTVRNHLKAAYRALGASSQVTAAVAALQTGQVRLPHTEAGRP